MAKTGKMIQIVLLLGVCFLFPLKMLHASFFIQHSLSYHTHDDDADYLSYNKMNNLLFLGASLDKSNRLFLGQSIHMWSKTHKASQGGAESDISITELGPRILYYFNDERTWMVSLVYNPYARGTRTINGQEEELSGSGYLLNFAYQIKISKSLFLGASVNYHSFSVSKSSVNNTETEVSQSYTSMMPMLDISFRFR